MFSEKIKNKNHKGFTFIEAMTLVFIFGMITVTFYNVISVGMRTIVVARNRLGAIALGNEKMEIARNLTYDDVGTGGGDCSGKLPQEESVTENGKTYTVENYATFVDDPFDGTLGGSPDDTAFHDYKKLETTVSWNNGGSDKGSVKFISSFVSPSLEVEHAGDGILIINVFGDQAGGGAVSGASVHVVNSEVGINETVQTDASGRVMLSGAKESLQKYQITVSKSGYETVNALPPYPVTAYNPIDTYATVIGGALNTTDIIENKSANLKISTVDYLGNPVANVGITLGGGRKLGTAVAAPFDPIYNLNFEGDTDSGGEKTFNSISPGQYSFGLSSSEATYKLIGVDHVAPFSLVSEDSANIKLKVANINTTGLLVEVTSSLDNASLAGATVRLENAGFSYDETITVGADGMAFFPVSDATVFQAGTYDLTVKADGFGDETKQEIITDGNLIIDEISMVAN